MKKQSQVKIKIKAHNTPTCRILYDEFHKQYSLILRSDEGKSESKKLSHDQPSGDQDNDKENELLFDPLDVLYQKQLRLTPKKRPSSTPKRRLRRRAGESYTRRIE